MKMPAEMRRSLTWHLPPGTQIVVIPRDSNQRRCAAWAADHYEIAAYRSSMGADLTELRDALAALPGVYALTFMPDRMDPSWPIRYRDLDLFRPQVRALVYP